MRHTKALILITALALCAALTAFALGDGPLTSVWNSGSDLLFKTDNVSLDGDATFTLDGKLFKTAKLHYVQDGYSSLYDLKLLTPLKAGGERLSGWTIVADPEGNYAVMEAYYPGTYKWGVDDPQNTLLRRTMQLDALAELGGLLVNQIDGTLPEGAVTVKDQDGQKTVRLTVAGDQIPPLAASALNVAARFLSDRWFGLHRDRNINSEYHWAFDGYIAPAQALADGTVHWDMRKVDVEFVIDAQNHLTSVSGSAVADSTFWDGSVREVAAQFNLTASNYGESTVKAFDPADYSVSLATEEYYR